MIPNTMQAVVTTGHGGLDRLDYTTVAVPRPEAGEVLVKVTACGVNNTEIWAREGRYGTDEDPDAVTTASRKPGIFPVIQGADVVGEIVAVGGGVPDARIGERVVVDYVIHDDDPGGVGYSGGMGSSRPGGYAQFCSAPDDNAIATSCPWSDAELATLPCAYTTAENMLTQAGVADGDLVAVTGASGGVGSAMIQLAHLRGARVIALASARKHEQVATLSPHALVATDGDVTAGLAAALGDRKLDAVCDVVGGPLFTPLLNGLRPLGSYVTAGAIAGPVITFDIRTVYLKHLRLVGTSLGTRDGFRRVVAAAEQGRIRPLLARTFPLADIREAHTFFKSKDFFGKLAVLPHGD